MTARLTPDQQRALDQARELLLADATGRAALTELIGCTYPAELYSMAYGVALSRMRRLTEVIAELTGGQSLVLEKRGQENRTPQIGPLMLTPAIDEDYWAYRVKLSDRQAIVGFPKFSTIGIGFAQEEDWNTNLPYTCGTEEIYEHIAHNKGDDAISRDDCLTAIRMVQEAARADRDGGQPAGHAFVRPGQVAPELPAPDACMECGQPEAAHGSQS